MFVCGFLQVGFVTGICCTCFLIRCVMVSSFNSGTCIIYITLSKVPYLSACNDLIGLFNRSRLPHLTRKLICMF